MAGAMALICASIDHDRIKLIGRWRSDKILRYLHVQAEPVMQRYAHAMVTAGDLLSFQITFCFIPTKLQCIIFDLVENPLETSHD